MSPLKDLLPVAKPFAAHTATPPHLSGSAQIRRHSSDHSLNSAVAGGQAPNDSVAPSAGVYVGIQFTRYFRVPRRTQVMLVVNQQAWTHTLETVIMHMTEDPEALKKHWEFSCEELLRTVELVRTDINKNLRTSLGAMVVMDVHNRDTTEELASLKISDIGEFDWLAQLRYAVPCAV